MIFLRYTWDHIKVEDYTNFLTPLEEGLPLSLRHIGSWLEGKDYYTSRQNPGDYYLLYSGEGCGRINYRLNEVDLHKGQLVLIDGEEIHSYKTGDCDAWHSVWFHFSGPAMASYFNIINPKDSFNLVDLKESRIIYDFYEKAKEAILKKEENKGLYLSSLIVEYLNKILAIYLKDKKKGLGANKDMETLHLIKMYIENNMHTIITQSQISEYFQIPQLKIEGLFQKYEGKSLANYIQDRYSLFQTADNRRISVDHPPWLLSAISYINDNFDKNILIKDIISKEHISKAVFIKAFKQYTSMKPLEYLTNVRIKHALYLLEKTDKKISTIASESGFPTASNFAANFKKWTGYTPTEYKERRLVN